MKYKNINSIKAIIGLAILTSLMSCSKYEEGPGVSFFSKTERVANDWEIDRAIENGEDVTERYDEYTLKLAKDGDASLSALYTFQGFSLETETNGTWEFEDDKEKLVLDFQDNDADNTFIILKLREDEMWLREEGGEVELRLDPK